MRVSKCAWTVALALAFVSWIAWPCPAQAGWTMTSPLATRGDTEDYLVIHDMVLVNESEGITVTCGLVHYYDEENVFKFLSRVRVVQDGTEIEADSGSFDLSTNRGQFSGAVSMIRPATDDDPYDIYLTCEELDLDAESGSFIARGQPVLRQVDQQGDEAVASADRVEYNGVEDFVSLTGNAVMDSANRRISADSIRFSLSGDFIELKNFTMQIALDQEEPAE